MEIVIVVGLLCAVGLASALTLLWQRVARLEERQRVLEKRTEAIEVELGHGPAHEAARGSGPVDLRADRTLIGRVRVLEIFVLVSRRPRVRR